MLRMRAFRLDQPSYIFFDITWWDLMFMGVGMALLGFISTLFKWGPFMTVGSMALGALLVYWGKRLFLRIFPYGTHVDFWRWMTAERYFYCYYPDPVAMPLITGRRKE